MIDAIVRKFGDARMHWAGGKEIRKEWFILRRRVKFEMRCSDGFGRFGGGWNWVLGIQIGGSTVILNCLFFSIRIDRKAKP